MKTNTQIKGDLAVCCDTSLAGRCTALSNVSVKGSLKVEGWLEAKNLKQPCKGLYPNEEALLQACPHPQPGWWALVGDTLPAEIFVVEDRQWTDSGNTGGSASIDLTIYDEAIERTNDRINDLSTQILEVEHPVSVADTSAADLIIADENGIPIATFAGGHIITANFNSANIVSDSAGSSSSDSSSSDSSSSISQGPTISSYGTVTLSGKWCALGDSITRQDADRADGLKGYQYWVRKQIVFAGGYVNKGIDGHKLSSLAASLSLIEEADYYTIAYGTNDWFAAEQIGSIDDYANDTGATTFFGAARKIIDHIYTVNPDALIIICTPRKCYYSSYVGSHWSSTNSIGKHLSDYADALREIAAYEALPVADFFAESFTNQHNLAALSIDDAVHPNTAGHKLLASVLIPKFLPLQYI